MNPIEKAHAGLSKITKYVSWAGLVASFFLMVVTTVDVILRKLPTGTSVRGSYDMTEMGMVVIVFFGIAYFQSEHGHVRVDMFVEKFPHTVRCIVEGCVNFFEAVFAVLMCYAAFQQISTLYERGVGTSVLHIPHWPFAVFMTIGLLIFTIFLVLDGIMCFQRIGEKPAKGTG